MEENLKNPGKIKKALKILAITVGIIIVAGIAVNMATENSGRTLSGSKISGRGLPEEATSFGSSNQTVTSPSPVKYSEKVAISDALPAEDPTDATVDKKVIKNGYLNLRVDSVDKSAGKISEIAKSNGGDVFSSSFSQLGTEAKSGSVTVKVPAKNFEKTFDELKKIAIIVTNESTTGQDVTEQYVDLQSQLKNKQAEEQAYIKLLDQASKMDDVISITRQLSTVRGEIERIQGKIRYMDSQTDMATISISLSEDTNVTIVDSWRPWQVVKESVNELVKSIQGWVDFLIKLIIKVIPVLLLYGLILLVFYKIGHWIYRRFFKKDTLA